jgi:hypothetical protein
MTDVAVIEFVPVKRRWELALCRAAGHLRAELTLEEALVLEHAIESSRGEARHGRAA